MVETNCRLEVRILKLLKGIQKNVPAAQSRDVRIFTSIYSALSNVIKETIHKSFSVEWKDACVFDACTFTLLQNGRGSTEENLAWFAFTI